MNYSFKNSLHRLFDSCRDNRTGATRNLIFLFNLLITATLTSTAYGGTGEKYARAMVWGNNPWIQAGSTYVPHSSFNYTQMWENKNGNSSGRDSSTSLAYISKITNGLYAVTLAGIELADGTVHVSAYGGNHMCKVGFWYKNNSNDTTTVWVHCFSNSGATIDGRFVLKYYRTGSTYSSNKQGYAWANNASSALNSNYTPTAPYYFNTSGQSPRIKRTSTGHYEVKFRGMEPDDAGEISLMVTSYGFDRTWCSVSAGFAGGTVYVGCYDTNGDSVDSQFTVSMIDKIEGTGAEYTSDRLKSEARTIFIGGDEYAGDTIGFLDSPLGLGDQVYREGRGKYRVDLYDVKAFNDSAAIVTSWTGVNEVELPVHCNPQNWGNNSNLNLTTSVYVRCYNSAGTLTDPMGFWLSYFTNENWN